MKPALIFALMLTACTGSKKLSSATMPAWMKGSFTDDYSIKYTVSDSIFSMDGVGRYHIREWNKSAQYLIVQNDSANKTEKGLYSRIDYMQLPNMEPYKWGYCLIVYDASDIGAARQAAPADRSNPKKGCNGYPFSRMKRSER